MLCKIFFLVLITGAGLTSAAQTNKAQRTISPDPDRGLYAIWYEQNPDVVNLPFIRGGQLMLQWAQLESAPGVYNFKPLDDALNKIQHSGRKVSIQINGNNKPAYLYNEIAVNPKMLSPQIRDKQGTLQFWDPAYLKHYIAFIKAYGSHLRQSKYKDNVLGVRLNFNPMGTEHYYQEVGSDKYKYTDIDKDYHSFNPASNGHRYEKSFTDDLMANYMKQIVDAFLTSFTPTIKVLGRYELLLPGHESDSTVRKYLADGKIGIFMTNSDARHAYNFKEQIFFDYCRSGLTYGYSEQFSDSEGHHAGGLMHFPQWPSAWNYWRLLGDLDCGISYLAIYGAELVKDKDPEYHSAFDFANKYVGYHASPAVSPGAWVALREPGQIKTAIAKTGPLENLTFLMEEVGVAGKLATNVGPDNQRYGAWARSIADNESLKFKLNDDFKTSVNNKPVQLCVIYLDNSAQPFKISWGQGGQLKSVFTLRKNSNRWQEAFIDVPSAQFNNTSETDITITAVGGGTFHLIEVKRIK